MEKWIIPLLSILLSSTLILRIFEMVVASVKKRKEKKEQHEDLPAKIEKINKKVDALTENTARGFADINKKLDNDSKHFASVDDTLNKLASAVNHNAEGTALGLENDIVIFNAFRDHHINGESEIAERKVRDYLLTGVHTSYTVSK